MVIDMRTQHYSLDQDILKYPLEKIAPLEKILLFDIETTGFVANHSYLYLIGCAYYAEQSWHIRQWFADSYDEEVQVLAQFFHFLSGYTHLLHFNGNSFDLPYLRQKAAQHKLAFPLDEFEGVDIYKRISPYKNFLKLPNCKQKTIEYYMNISREDEKNGKELIQTYHDYTVSQSETDLRLLLLHNKDDIRGMLQILPMLAYHDLLFQEVTAKKVQANSYKDYNGIIRQELFIQLTLPTPIPVPVTSMGRSCYFKGDGLTGSLIIPIYEEELKYFYANYRDYYYLPDEDNAFHKSVAMYVDPQFRKPATASTCYTRKLSTFLPQWDAIIHPFFKRDYQSKELFFEITDEVKKDRALFSLYASHVLNMIALQ